MIQTEFNVVGTSSSLMFDCKQGSFGSWYALIHIESLIGI